MNITIYRANIGENICTERIASTIILLSLELDPETPLDPKSILSFILCGIDHSDRTMIHKNTLSIMPQLVSDDVKYISMAFEILSLFLSHEMAKGRQWALMGSDRFQSPSDSNQ